MRKAHVIRVMEPFTRIRETTNPYIKMLHESLERTPGVQPLTFSYRRALFGGYDVVHLHWPEAILAGRTPLRRFARDLLAHAYLLRLWAFRVPVVRTVHNLDLPTGLNRIELAYLRGIDRLTTLRILLNETTQGHVARGVPVALIPHGHYRDWYAEYPKRPASPGRIGFIGLIRRYKNVTGLVEAYSAARTIDPRVTLSVAGLPSSDELASEIIAAAEGVPAVTLDFRFLDDADFVATATACELLVLPYHHMHNSGVVLAALSLERPVLVPDNPTTRAIQEEIGPGWVVTFDGEFTGETIMRALAEVRGPRASRPDLSQRDWDEAGRAHRNAFLLALRTRRLSTRRRTLGVPG